jgi:hypothetical protein
MHRIMKSVQDLIKEPLPIKCLEAVFVAIYLTNAQKDLVRLPLTFKSSSHGKVYRHIVLAVRYNGRYGALGLSRQPSLMYKGLEYTSLADLVKDYQNAYHGVFHKLDLVRVGLPVVHDDCSNQQICWRFLKVDVSKDDWIANTEKLNAFAREAETLGKRYCDRYDVWDLTHVGDGAKIGRKSAMQRERLPELQRRKTSSKSRMGRSSSGHESILSGADDDSITGPLNITHTTDSDSGSSSSEDEEEEEGEDEKKKKKHVLPTEKLSSLNGASDAGDESYSKSKYAISSGQLFAV